MLLSILGGTAPATPSEEVTFFTLSFALDLTPTLTSSPHLPILLPTYHQTRFFDPPTTPTRVPTIFYFSTILGAYTRTVPITTHHLSINIGVPRLAAFCAILPTGCLNQQTTGVHLRFSRYQHARTDSPGPTTAIYVYMYATATTIQFSVSDRKRSVLKIGAEQEDPHDTNP